MGLQLLCVVQPLGTLHGGATLASNGDNVLGVEGMHDVGRVSRHNLLIARHSEHVRNCALARRVEVHLWLINRQHARSFTRQIVEGHRNDLSNTVGLVHRRLRSLIALEEEADVREGILIRICGGPDADPVTG